MKVGDLVQVSVKGRKMGRHWALVGVPHNMIGIVTDVIEQADLKKTRYTVEWNDGHQTSMTRDEIKFA